MLHACYHHEGIDTRLICYIVCNYSAQKSASDVTYARDVALLHVQRRIKQMYNALPDMQQADQEALRTLMDTIATISSRLVQLGETKAYT
jgi:hypothetical protein